MIDNQYIVECYGFDHDLVFGFNSNFSCYPTFCLYQGNIATPVGSSNLRRAKTSIANWQRLKGEHVNR